MTESVETIAKLKKKLKKAKDATDTALDILGVLQRATITRSILEQTGVGKTVGKLAAKTKDANVKSATEALLKKWKSIATKEKQAKKAAKQALGSDAASIPADDLRKRVCTMFQKEFSNPNISDKVKLTVCVGIERAMFVKFDKNTQSKEYKGKFRSLKFNLGKNSDLRARLVEGKVTAEQLVSMKASELASVEKQKERKELLDMEGEKVRSDYMDANRDKINEQAGIDKVGGLIACEECNSTKTTHYQKQTRGADEPMTVFAQCTDCGHNWRFGDH